MKNYIFIVLLTLFSFESYSRGGGGFSSSRCSSSSFSRSSSSSYSRSSSNSYSRSIPSSSSSKSSSFLSSSSSKCTPSFRSVNGTSYSKPCYTKTIVHENEIHVYHSYNNGYRAYYGNSYYGGSTMMNTMLLYYLLFNQNTHTYDTIRGKDKADLEKNVQSATLTQSQKEIKEQNDFWSTISWIVGMLVIVGIVYLIIKKTTL